MNLEEYISSGVLELYATGALPLAEKAEVELLAMQHPEIQTELNLIQNTLDRYAQLHAVKPPDHLRSKVLTAVAESSQLKPDNFKENNRLHTPVATESDPVIPISRNKPAHNAPVFNWLVAAALALLVLSNGLSYYFYRNWKRSEQNLALALDSQRLYARDVQQVKQQLNLAQQELAFVTDNATERIALKGVPKSPESQVMVYWHRPSQRVVVEVESLPLPPAGKQYQLWALENGKPIDAGVLGSPANPEQLHRMKNVAAAQAFAITLEPQGGSVNPTLDQMVVMGQI